MHIQLDLLGAYHKKTRTCIFGIPSQHEMRKLCLTCSVNILTYKVHNLMETLLQEVIKYLIHIILNKHKLVNKQAPISLD